MRATIFAMLDNVECAPISLLEHIVAKDFFNITLALGGIFQASTLVHQLATTGGCDETAYKTSINSILFIDAPDVLSIYGNQLTNLNLGLKQLKNSFDTRSKKKSHPDIARYVISLVHLERKLFHDTGMLKRISTGIAQTQNKISYFGEFHPNVIASLAELYVNNFGRLNFRIPIKGKGQYLHNPQTVDKCRALFLAGIRSAVLWHQVGGTRLQLLLARRKISNSANLILG